MRAVCQTARYSLPTTGQGRRHIAASGAPSDRQFVGIMIACHSAFTGGSNMAELVRTNDPGVISAIEGLLGGADIPYQVTDRNMSVLEGSIIAIQMRILVPDDHEAEARELLVDADLGNWLRP